MTKLEILKNDIKKLGNLAIAFSGGVDSSLLLKVAADVLKENALALTVKSPYMSLREIDEAVEFAKFYGIKHEIFEVGIAEEIKLNPQNRCYLCKKAVFSRLLFRAKELGFTNLADGTNKDDLGEYRPGLKAKEELGVLSPLINLGKDDIRQMSRELNLPTAEKPSYACLLTRLPYGHEVSLKDINLVEMAENLLIKNGYANIRARFDGKNMKLQMPFLSMQSFLNDAKFKTIVKELVALGAVDVMLDLKGLREDVLV